MTRIFLFHFVILNFTISYCQNVAINQNGLAPNNSAGLDVEFTNKGFLPPRVADTTSIVSPAEGLMIFDLSSSCMRYHTNVKWSDCMADVSYLPIGSITTINCSNISVSGNLCELVPSVMSISVPYNGATFGTYNGLVVNSTGVTGLTLNINSGVFNTSGSGNLIFNLNGTPNSNGVASFNINIGNQVCIVSINVNAEPNPVMVLSPSSITLTSALLSWVAVSNANDYYLDVATNSTFTNLVPGYSNLLIGNVSSYTVTGLAVGTTYYCRLRSSNTCGVSVNSTIISFSTLGCNPSQPASAYGTVTGIPIASNTLTWMNRNLGSSLQAISLTDGSAAAAGCYYQFNRTISFGVNGLFTSGSNSNPNWNITFINENLDWTIANDPCRINLGAQWRLPTYSEWSNIDNIYAWSNGVNGYTSPLKVHYAGFLDPNTGVLSELGNAASYWTSSQASFSYARAIRLDNMSSNVTNFQKATGFPVRCVF